jgi:hypothetical protein
LKNHHSIISFFNMKIYILASLLVVAGKHIYYTNKIYLISNCTFSQTCVTSLVALKTWLLCRGLSEKDKLLVRIRLAFVERRLLFRGGCYDRFDCTYKYRRILYVGEYYALMRAKLSLVRKIRCSRTFAFKNL